MDRKEARSILEDQLTRLREETYQELSRLVDESEWIDIVGDSGQEYAIKLFAVWDSGRKGKSGILRVIADISDGSRWRKFAPLSSSFLISREGTFIGE